jgi:transposase
MGKLDSVSTAALRDHLDAVETAKAAKRLMVALAYADGVPATTLSDRYGIPASTVYYWLDRFEQRPLADAIEDEPRPGRPRKLAPEEWERLESALEKPPADAGYDADEWTPALVQRHLEREFSTTYSTGYIRQAFAELLD